MSQHLIKEQMNKRFKNTLEVNHVRGNARLYHGTEWQYFLKGLYGAFTQTATYSVANQLGFFTAYGLNVTLPPSPELDLPLHTAPQRRLRYLDRHPSITLLTVTGQLDQGPELTIGSVPNITSIGQLKGLSLMIDSPVSGYAYLLRKVLSLYGLNPEDGDYSFQVVGSTVTRYADLVAGQLPNGTAVYATILTYPFTSETSVVPVARRPNVLAAVSDFIQPITSSTFTVRSDALNNTTQRALIRTFMAAMYSANQFLAYAAQKNCSIAAIANQLNVSTAAATSAYNSAINPLTGETSSPGGNLIVNRQRLLNVTDVQSQFGGFAQVPAGFNFAEAILPGQGKLIDYSVRNEALNATVQYRPVGC